MLERLWESAPNLADITDQHRPNTIGYYKKYRRTIDLNKDIEVLVTELNIF